MNNPYGQHPQQSEGNRGRNERWNTDDNRGSPTWREEGFNRSQNRSSWGAQQGGGYGPSRYSQNFAGQADQGEGHWGLGQTGQEYFNSDSQYSGNFDDFDYRGNDYADQQRRSRWNQEFSPYSGQEYQPDITPRQTQPIRSDYQRWGQDSSRNWQQQAWQGRQAPVTNQFGGSQYGNPFGTQSQFNRGSQDFGNQQYVNEHYGYERNPSPQSWRSQSPDAYSTTGQPTGAFGLEQTTHRGKGPKGYTRTDERIREEICECLSDDHRIDATDISVQVKEGVVTLEGSVFDRAQKHRVEDIADRCSGVRDVHNSLRVTQHASQLASNEKGDKSAGKSH